MLGQVRGQPVQAVQHGEGRVDRGRDVGCVGRRKLADGRLGQVRRAREQGVALGALARRKRRLEQLPDDAEGELALELGPARGKHGEALALGFAPDRTDQRRLADPRRPRDEQAAAGTASGRAEHLCGLPELRAPLEQGSHARSRNHSQVQLYLSGCPRASVWAWPARETSSRASAGSG